MRDLFNHYKSLSKQDKDILWSDCIFAFDTNILLNFYRYSNQTSKLLEDAIRHYDQRAWIPYQVGLEFYDNRLDVIEEQIDNYNIPNKYLSSIRKLFSSKKGHPFISESLYKDFDLAANKIEAELQNQKKDLANLFSNDHILELIQDLFENKVGEPYSNLRLNELYTEARERFLFDIPPGFKDKSKPEPKRYGDFIIWKQLIDKSKAEKRPIIFVSDDEKEDWLFIFRNRSFGPLPTLVKEFRDNTGQPFHICQAFEFTRRASLDMSNDVDNNSLEEMRIIASSRLETSSIAPFNFYHIECIIKSKKDLEGHFDKFHKALSSKGYYIYYEVVSKYEHHLSLNVPFQDLVRRFHRTLLPLLEEYKLELVSFHSEISKDPSDTF